MTTNRSVKTTRVKACELAAEMMQGCGGDAEIGPRLMSLVVFFETYIHSGCDATNETMQLLKRRGKKRLHVVAGGRLGSFN